MGGSVLVVADSGQIEARVLAWLAGQTDKLDTFRKNDAETARYQTEFQRRAQRFGGDPTRDQVKEIDRELAALGIQEGDLYAEAGTRYFGRKITKKDTPVERQVAKSMELGLGFGLGSFTFTGSLLKGFLGAPPVRFTAEQARSFGVDVYRFQHEPMWREGPTGAERTRELLATGARATYADLLVHFAVTDHFVKLYRKQNARIAAYWKTMEGVLQLMSEPAEPGEVRARVGPLEVMHQAIRKPSGLVLRYDKLHRSGDGWKYWGYKEGRMQWVKTYGGSLTENVVQSLARDAVAEQALWVRAGGYRIGTTTHDEIVAVTSEKRGEACLELMLDVMKRAPDWAPGLPLWASGGIARSYGDAK